MVEFNNSYEMMANSLQVMNKRLYLLNPKYIAEQKGISIEQQHAQALKDAEKPDEEIDHFPGPPPAEADEPHEEPQIEVHPDPEGEPAIDDEPDIQAEDPPTVD